MLTNEILIDSFERIKREVHNVCNGPSTDEFSFRVKDSANTIAWLIWHLTRVQDDHVAGLADAQQQWMKGWSDKFRLPFEQSDTGYGHTQKEVAAVRAEAKLLVDYYDAVHSATVKFIKQLNDKDYSLVVDKRWDPPVTIGVRLVSVISDDLQHVGQAAYIKGLL